MALFQSSVLKDHLRLQEQQQVDEAYQNFTAFFHNPEIQENIRSSKEEQFQATFLNELFVKILGYSMNPQPGYELTTEFKNQKNNRKADGAILKEGLAIGVIELKGTNTKHLEGIRQQAFDYKANQKGCVYVITSNFEKLRFYINDATEFLEFDLFELNREDFSLLYLCLHKDNIFSNRPLKIKEASIVEEEVITKQFYKDYSVFKRELFRDLVLRNVDRIKKDNNLPRHPELDSGSDFETETKKKIRLSLFKKSQKLIDRFLFIFFAEDRGLLPPNSIHRILADWNKLKDLDAVMPLYDRFKLYFGFLDTGRKGTDKKAEIFAYNGGLFKPDHILDMLEIDDELLFKHTSRLATYDFESQVDVNILGHIFENSLNEIESVNAEIEGADFDKQKSKRKKDGVFYTPKYITKYIVENTVGRLCEEKKTELGFREEEYYRGRKQRQAKTVKALIKILEDYREWLLKLTICDPACGSGAFLNQALDFLIKEHQYIDEMKAKLLGGGLIFSDIETTILENNIYGVDINEESVEIAKLSLWLRTAQPRRKLNDLSSYIKCGNSLIDDKKVAGKKAFKWETEFPEVFANGGFDVVIGNPPYVPTELIPEMEKDYLEKVYFSAFGRINLYPIFYEKGINVLNSKGYLSFITPYTLLKNRYYRAAREYILKNSNLYNLIDFKGQTVFKDAAVDSIILSLSKGNSPESHFEYIADTSKFQSGEFNSVTIDQKDFLKNDDLSFNISLFEKIITKISINCVPVKEVLNFKQGIITGGNSKFVTSEKADNTKKLITGSDFNRFYFDPPDQFIIYNTEKLHRPRIKEIFEADTKIILRQTGAYPIATIDRQQYYTLDTVHNGLIINDDYSPEYLLALLNSKLFRFFYENSINESGKVFAQVKIMYIADLPVKIPSHEQQKEISKATASILSVNKDFKDHKNSFSNFFSSSYSILQFSKKLQSWHELEFGDFIKELNKAIKASNKERAKAAAAANGKPGAVGVTSSAVGVTSSAVEMPLLTKKDEFEWMELFEENKKKAVELQREIEKTDKEIDQMVYELYGLTEEEIAIVEG